MHGGERADRITGTGESTRDAAKPNVSKQTDGI
jgi:hypothetical protein